MTHPQADSFVWYRLPHSREVVRRVGNLQRAPDFYSMERPAFVVAPFQVGLETTWCFKPHVGKERTEAVEFTYLPQKPGAEGKRHYLQLVSKGLAEIRSGQFNKLVLANRRLLTGADSPIDLFEQLEEHYPGAFVYLLSAPQTGTWIGASPEPLLIQDQDRFLTVAMAGTRTAEKENPFGSKEQAEQKWVEQYIGDFLKGEGIDYTKNGPNEFSAGNLRHLRTEFQFQHTSGSTQLAQLLHPTPAVSGLPKAESMDFILREEGFPRELYAGFLGPVGPDYARLFVNLRCLQWHPEGVSLYAGAGITGSSNPELEWQETQNKMETLEKYLREN